MTVVYTIMSAEALPAADIQSKLGTRPHRSPPRNQQGEITCTHEECKDDQVTFKRLCEFNKHMDKHERPYKCGNPACRKNPGFTYAGGLLRHQREVHSMHRTKEPFFCPHTSCNRSTGTGFSRQENLQEHLRRRHSGAGVGISPGGPGSVHSNDAATESPTPTVGADSMHQPTYLNVRPPHRLEPLPISRKRRVAAEAETDDDLDRSSDITTTLDEAQLRTRIAILQQDNERIRTELYHREQQLAEVSRDNERLRSMLTPTLPPPLPPHINATQAPTVYHRAPSLTWSKT